MVYHRNCSDRTEGLVLLLSRVHFPHGLPQELFGPDRRACPVIVPGALSPWFTTGTVRTGPKGLSCCCPGCTFPMVYHRNCSDRTEGLVLLLSRVHFPHGLPQELF